ncbi:Aerobic glycerol-3-phosphate dehydrogenase [hydrothermal vent metagenome]|uniref:Aerobic glycerol-3-phosphate dehydrogenase n=1 Tax=hydrothermal vent metagenome TaxID=652676 RepID=A0A3B1AWV1_9ZZZZ
MSTVDYDLLVIGGGIQGAGVAQAGAAAGYNVLLLEKTAIASATSSRSSKLIHGGLRYLESMQFGLVRKALRERDILLRIAPELVKPVAFHIPVYKTSIRAAWKIWLGLSLYALLGGLKPLNRFQHVAVKASENQDGLKAEGLVAEYQYWDAQTDDAALTRAVMNSAQMLGAELICPAEVISAHYHKNSYHLRYKDHSGEKQLHCHALVNASGPWVNQVLEKLFPQSPRLEVDLVQGTHVLLDRPAPSAIYYVEAVADKRAVFVMPWKDRTLVGTTETFFQGEPDQVRPTEKEIQYLLSVYADYFPGDPAEMIDSFAGVRVLPKTSGRFFNRPRDTVLHLSPPGLISLYGGKLTGYRATAKQVIAKLQVQLPEREVKADTEKLILNVTAVPLTHSPWREEGSFI